MGTRAGIGWTGLGVLLAVLAAGFSAPVGADKNKPKPDSEWRFFGRDSTNNHHAAGERKIRPHTVGDLQVRWVYETTAEVEPTPFGQINGDVTATPAVVDGT
ncbi:MAG: hypothetical protein MJE66_10110, partial [Proteobacteria bacterium]|nr:hypothetical protein [Pseudomonadota bacterium]